jgi:hypothetical protein
MRIIKQERKAKTVENIGWLLDACYLFLGGTAFQPSLIKKITTTWYLSMQTTYFFSAYLSNPERFYSFLSSQVKQ